MRQPGMRGGMSDQYFEREGNPELRLSARQGAVCSTNGAAARSIWRRWTMLVIIALRNCSERMVG
jgi:hypothetical protein